MAEDVSKSTTTPQSPPPASATQASRPTEPGFGTTSCFPASRPLQQQQQHRQPPFDQVHARHANLPTPSYTSSLVDGDESNANGTTDELAGSYFESRPLPSNARHGAGGDSDDLFPFHTAQHLLPATAMSTSTSSPWAAILDGDGGALDDDALAAFLRHHHFAEAAAAANDAPSRRLDGAAAGDIAQGHGLITDDTWAMLGMESHAAPTNDGHNGFRRGSSVADGSVTAATLPNASGSDTTLFAFPTPGAHVSPTVSVSTSNLQNDIASPSGFPLYAPDHQRLPDTIRHLHDAASETEMEDNSAQPATGSQTTRSRYGPMDPPPVPSPLPSPLPPPALEHRTSSSDCVPQGSRPPTSGDSASLPAIAASKRVVMVSGPLAGAAVRFTLEIHQQPEQGRSFTDRDRRAIIPPPILRLTLTESVRKPTTHNEVNQSMKRDRSRDGNSPIPLEDDAMWTEKPLRLDQFDVSGLVCTADVIHLSAPTNADTAPSYTLANNVPKSSAASSSHSPPPTSSPHEVLTPSSASMEAFHDAMMRTERIDSMESSATAHSMATTLSSITPSTVLSASSAASAGWDAVSQRVRNLFGNTSVGGRHMLGPDDKHPSIWFMFPDISVKRPGQYALRFRCYDVLQMTSADPTAGSRATAASSSRPPRRTPMVAECFSETFVVYTTKSYPTPPPISKLTEHFTR